MVTKNKTAYLLNGGSLALPLSPDQILLLLLALTFGVTAIDVTIAHWENHFIPLYEWIPVVYSPVATLVVLLYALCSKRAWISFIYQVSMLLGVFMGILGSIFHLFGNITTTNSQALSWFKVGIPVLAPVAYTGMALLGLALLKPNPQKLMRLISLAFLVTAITVYLDHAQGHFQTPYTLIPIVAGLLAFLVIWLYSNWAGKSAENLSSSGRAVANWYYAVMVMMMFVGVLGFYFHVSANLAATTQLSWTRMFYYTPAMAPLGYAQLGLMGMVASLTE